VPQVRARDRGPQHAWFSRDGVMGGANLGESRRKKMARHKPEEDFLPANVSPAPRDFDPALADFLREWRRALARENKIPAYVILHDSTLEELCCRRPRTRAQLMQVPGIGERKADVYGAEILQALRNFADGARVAPAVPAEITPGEQTLQLLREGRTFAEIARLRARQLSTVVGTVANLIETGHVKLDPKWISPDAQPLIEAACLAKGVERLRDIKDAVPPYVSFNDIRLVVASLRSENRLEAKTGARTA
jgi:ATP-dependent DNA helicase RecQ